MSKPTQLPRWADVGGDIVEPMESKKDIGWVVGDQPPAQYENWLMNLIYQWTAWLDDFESTAHTWTANQTISAATLLVDGATSFLKLDTDAELWLNDGAKISLNTNDTEITLGASGANINGSGYIDLGGQIVTDTGYYHRNIETLTLNGTAGISYGTAGWGVAGGIYMESLTNATTFIIPIPFRIGWTIKAFRARVKDTAGSTLDAAIQIYDDGTQIASNGPLSSSGSGADQTLNTGTITMGPLGSEDYLVAVFTTTGGGAASRRVYQIEVDYTRV